MGRQIRPAKVYQAVSQELKQQLMPGYVTAQPSWHQVIGSIPPAESLVRTISPQHRAPNTKATKPKNMYRPQRITYPEDALRSTFYKDHPWELARPRMVLEIDGKDHQRCDWSKGLRQPGIPLSGECVVQRQLYLMEVEKMGKRKAYDTVRKEFYRLRQEEEIQRRVALEEAKHVGAYFGKTRLDVGMQLEDQEFENWKIWAGKESANREAQFSAEVDSFGAEELPAEPTPPEVTPARA